MPFLKSRVISAYLRHFHKNCFFQIGKVLLNNFLLFNYGAGTSSRTAPILEQIPKNSPKKQELAGNAHTS